MGDVARTVPCLASLRRAYPEAQIDWLVDSAFVDAVRAHPALSGVVPFDRKTKASVWPLLRRLRQEKYDLVFDLQGLARSGLFAWATRAPVRVGDANARELGWLGVNHRHDVDPTRHAIERMTALLSAQGIEVVHDLSLHVPAEDRTWRETFGAEHGLTAGRYACVAPTAQWGCKCWPMSRYAEVTQRLLERDDIDRVVILAAPHEQAKVQAGFTDFTPAQHERVMAPTTTVGQLMALLQDARLVVGNDSAPLHLAVGLDTPTVSLFGPTDPALVGPPPPPPPEMASPVPASTSASHRVLRAPSAVGQTFNYRTHRDDDTLISELTVDAVWDAVVEQLP
ncbi:MAG: glycosyltransferase family 9 protein [Planctomycetota bacterium]